MTPEVEQSKQPQDDPALTFSRFIKRVFSGERLDGELTAPSETVAQQPKADPDSGRNGFDGAIIGGAMIRLDLVAAKINKP